MDKLCHACGTVKDEEEFHRKGAGRSGRCKKCTRVTDARAYALRADAKIKTQVEWERKNRWHSRNKVKARKRRYKIGHTEKEWQDLLNKVGVKCVLCSKTEDITKDHVIPLSKGGTDEVTNLQPLCRSCNSSKGNRIRV